jgi:hypothetical protein
LLPYKTEDFQLFSDGWRYFLSYFCGIGVIYHPEKVVQRFEHIHKREPIFSEMMNKLQSFKAVEPHMELLEKSMGVAMVPHDARPHLVKMMAF